MGDTSLPRVKERCLALINKRILPSFGQYLGIFPVPGKISAVNSIRVK